MEPSEQSSRQVFEAVLSLTDPGERRAWIESKCAGDDELRREVESLLQAHEQAGDFMGRTVPLPAPDFVIEHTGTMIGRYKLLEKIGEGGFGVVYMAEQLEPVQRKVALKIIKAGMDTKEVIARFEAERQALALMDHPSIANILDAGATEAGRPYFVMELVRGIPITDYCDQKSLPTVERLQLFMKVCHAVQHAHQKGIIHRDLKPNNVLVTLHDGESVPKVIDFGVAKALGQKLTEKTLFTAFQQMIGTPAYMSPEQAELSGLDVDTRSDIYSLGVLLYELLTGVTPFDGETLRQVAMDEMRRMIRETEPLKPSTRLAQLVASGKVGRITPCAPSGDQLSSEVGAHGVTRPATKSPEGVSAASRRLLQVKERLRMVRGDLDWIVMKALEKDRKRRYETPDAFASDVARHLGNEPVEAGPPSAIYRFGKMVRRHRTAFVAGSAVAVSLVAGFTISTVLFFQERAARRISFQERHRADEQAAIATAVNEFLQTDLLAQAAPDADPEERPEPDLKVRTVLDRASRKIEGRFPNQPQVEAALRATLAGAYHGLGEYTNAELHLRRALQIYRRERGETNAETLSAAAGLGDLARHLGKTAEAEALLQQTLSLERQVLDSHHTNTLRTMFYLARVYQESGRTNAGRTLMEEALQSAMIDPGPESDTVFNLLNSLASMLADEGKWPEAEAKFRQALDAQRKLHGAESLNVARTLVNFSVILLRQKRFAEGEPLAREAVSLLRRFLGPESLDVVRAMQNLAGCLDKQGRAAEAEMISREVLALKLKLLDPKHPEVADALHNLARDLGLQDKLAESEEMLRRELTIRMVSQGPDHGETIDATDRLVDVLLKQGKWTEAETLAREAIGYLPRVESGKHDVPRFLSFLGAALIGQGKWIEAESTLSEALRQKETHGSNDTETTWIMTQLARTLAEQRKPVEAENLLRKAVAAQRGQSNPESKNVVAAEVGLTQLLAENGKIAEAEALFFSNWRVGALMGLNWASASNRFGLVPEEALQKLTAAIQELPPSECLTPGLWARAALEGRLGQSQAAANDLARPLDIGEEYFLLGLPLVPLWIDSGGVPDYENYRQRLLARYHLRVRHGARPDPRSSPAEDTTADDADPETAAAVALALLVYPSAFSYEFTARLADSALDQGSNHVRLVRFQMVKALGEYRLLHFAGASEWARRSLAGNADPATTVMANAVRAMSEHQLKLPEQARAPLAIARKALTANQPVSENGNHDLGENWPDWLIAKLLVNQAIAVVEHGASGTNGVAAAPDSKAPGDPLRCVLATVNDKPIFQSDIDRKMGDSEARLRRQFLGDHSAERARPGEVGEQMAGLTDRLFLDHSFEFQHRLDELRSERLESLIDRELLLTESLEAGCKVTKGHLDSYIHNWIQTAFNGDSNRFLRTLTNNGTTLDQYREQRRQDALVAAAQREKTRNLPSPTADQIEQYYHSHETEFRVEESVKLGLIVINKNPTNGLAAVEARRKDATAIHARLAVGADFAAEAKLYSQGALAQQGGDWGWVKRGVLRNELDAVAFSLKSGQVSGVIETEVGWFILRVADHRPAVLKPLAAVREDIGKILQTQEHSAAMSQWMKSLRAKACVRYYSGVAGATGRPENRVVTIEINRVGASTISEPAIRSHLGVKEGELVTQASVDHDIRSLYASGNFYNIRAGAKTVTGGIKLIYAVQEKPWLIDIQFTGNKNMSSGELLPKLTSETGERLDEWKLFNDSQTIQSMYHKAGYPQATVKYVLHIDEKAGRGSVSFEITEGPQ